MIDIAFFLTALHKSAVKSELEKVISEKFDT